MTGKLGATAAFVVVYIFAGELFPTDVRATGLGLCNVFARTGGILAPMIISLPGVVSLLLLGALAACATCATLLVDETLGKPLKDVMDEDNAMIAGTNIELGAVGEDEPEESTLLTTQKETDGFEQA